MARAAFADAHRHFERALTYRPVQDEGVRAGLLAERGRAARALGKLPEALADLQEALDVFERLHAVAATSGLVLDISRLLDLLGRHQESAKVAQRALGALGEAPSQMRGQLLALTARWSAFEGDFTAANLALDQAAACAAKLDDPGVAGHILHARSWTASARFDCTEAAEAGLAAVRLLGEAGEEWEASQAGVLAQTVLIHAGRFAQAEGLTAGLMHFARRVGHHAVDLWVLRNTATVARMPHLFSNTSKPIRRWGHRGRTTRSH
jgi:tetratricopeptide (TPR) repeat protein